MWVAAAKMITFGDNDSMVERFQEILTLTFCRPPKAQELLQSILTPLLTVVRLTT